LTVNGIAPFSNSSSSSLLHGIGGASMNIANGGSNTAHAGAPSSSTLGSGGFRGSGVRGAEGTEAIAAAPAAPGGIEGRPAAAAAATAEVCLGPSNHAAGKKERWKRGAAAAAAAAATTRRIISSTDGPGGACLACGVDAALRAEPCVVCWEALPEVVLLPCKHLVLCVGCSAQVAGVGGECPMCRAAVTEHMRVFRL
jgi:hypothetical protein